MLKMSRLAMATAMVMFASGAALAQTTPGAGSGNTAAPAATTPPAAATTPSSAPAAAQSDTGTGEKSTPKKKKSGARKMTRQQEIDHSIDTGTVPARYRNSIPKQYHQYIPFDKR